MRAAVALAEESLVRIQEIGLAVERAVGVNVDNVGGLRAGQRVERVLERAILDSAGAVLHVGHGDRSPARQERKRDVERDQTGSGQAVSVDDGVFEGVRPVE